MPPRVLILSAKVGEGHDRPALHLAAQLRAEEPSVEVEIDDSLAVMGRVVTLIGESAPRVVFYRARWLWDLGFWAFAGSRLPRAASQRLITRLGAPGLLRLIERRHPDVVVSVYPGATEVLGRLRRDGRLDVPVVAAITDLAGLYYWASPGVDVHLVTHRESIDEVRTIAGAQAAAHVVHGFSAPEFLEHREADEARASLDLPSGKIVLVSGGGWGVGDVGSAVEEALAVTDVAQVVALCGRNDGLRASLARRFNGNRRVRVEGFTESMSDWLAAADVLVHSTGGLTVLEALMRGCVPISFGWGRGHVSANDRAFRRFGLADVVESRADLPAAIERALARGRSTDDSFRNQPSAASFVLAAARAC